ncbi:hypothetical protein T492DRAFT_864300 [Pavlovales sp. CCMP2436]|nr:hypothetical protein T492DRAFT_864300 [Pavlovales sp. CCMP2436]
MLPREGYRRMQLAAARGLRATASSVRLQRARDLLVHRPRAGSQLEHQARQRREIASPASTGSLRAKATPLRFVRAQLAAPRLAQPSPPARRSQFLYAALLPAARAGCLCASSLPGAMDAM